MLNIVVRRDSEPIPNGNACNLFFLNPFIFCVFAGGSSSTSISPQETRIPSNLIRFMQPPPPYPCNTASTGDNPLPSHHHPITSPVVNPTTSLTPSLQSLMMMVQGGRPTFPHGSGVINSGPSEIRQLLKKPDTTAALPQTTHQPGTVYTRSGTDDSLQRSSDSQAPCGLFSDQVVGAKQTAATSKSANVSTKDASNLMCEIATVEKQRQCSTEPYSANPAGESGVWEASEKTSLNDCNSDIPKTNQIGSPLNGSESVTTSKQNIGLEDDPFLDWVLNSPSADIPLESEEEINIIQENSLDSDDCQELPAPVAEQRSCDKKSCDQTEGSHDSQEKIGGASASSADVCQELLPPIGEQNCDKKSCDQTEQLHDNYDKIGSDSQELVEPILFPKEPTPIISRAVSVKSAMRKATFGRLCYRD